MEVIREDYSNLLVLKEQTPTDKLTTATEIFLEEHSITPDNIVIIPTPEISYLNAVALALCGSDDVKKLGEEVFEKETMGEIECPSRTEISYGNENYRRTLVIPNVPPSVKQVEYVDEFNTKKLIRYMISYFPFPCAWPDLVSTDLLSAEEVEKLHKSELTSTLLIVLSPELASSQSQFLVALPKDFNQFNS